MLKKLKQIINKLKDNKIIKIIYNIIYYILFVIVVLLLVVVLLQRLSNNCLSFGGYRIFNVVTGSMVPKYLVGDVLLSKEVPENQLKAGDDVVYLGEKSDFAGKYITHQIIKIDKTTNGTVIIHTKGIANEIEDPTISPNQIKGVIVYKFIILSFMSKLIFDVYSMYFLIFIPIAIIIFMYIMKLISNKDKGDKL